MTSPTQQAAAAPVHGRASRFKRIGTGAAVLAVLAVIAWAAPSWGSLASGHEATEDAYVEGNVVQVTPQVGGTVTRIAADNTDFVRQGETLVQLNALDAQIAVDKAEAQLSKAVRQVRVQFANTVQMRAGLALRAADLSKARADLERRRDLAGSGAVSGEEVRHAEDAVKAADAAYAAAEQQLAGSQALVSGTSVDTHPDVLAAIAQVRDACAALARTRLAAPVSGIVARRSVQIGQRVAQGTPLMAIVPLDRLWVTANFKESQLRHLKIGQKAVVHADAYGRDVAYTGRVAGQEAGTGSAFALMPPQNATGNWIKVVQRVPVRIALDAAQALRHPLRLGLSMRVEVDTRDQGGPALATAGALHQQYGTDVFADEARTADLIIQRVLHPGREAALAAR